jgi:hypothetical protein
MAVNFHDFGPLGARTTMGLQCLKKWEGEMMWKEVVMAYFKPLCQHLSEETERNTYTMDEQLTTACIIYFCSFVVYLTMLSVAETIYCRMRG